MKALENRGAETRSRHAAPALIAAVALAMSPACRGAAAQEPRELAVCADPSNLPYSNARREGFENRIASLIADDLGIPLRYEWNMQRRSFLRRTLNAGACDVVIGVPTGLRGVLETRPYYASTYVFVSLKSRHLAPSGFDDPLLRELKIGLHALGAEGANTPVANALARRGLAGNVTGYPMWGEEEEESPPARIIDAVARGDIDMALVWGPFAGYFAKRHPGLLDVAPVAPDPLPPTLAFTYEMALGVRKDDAALRDALQGVLDRRQGDIQRILSEFGVPLATPAPRTDTASAALPLN